MKLQNLSCRGKLSQFVVNQLCKQKESQPVNVVRMKAIMCVISSTTYFSIRLRLFSSTLSGVQLNLVKVSVMHAFWHHTSHQILFGMSKNENVIQQLVKVKKNSNASCYLDVILEQISLIL